MSEKDKVINDKDKQLTLDDVLLKVKSSEPVVKSVLIPADKPLSLHKPKENAPVVYGEN